MAKCYSANMAEENKLLNTCTAILLVDYQKSHVFNFLYIYTEKFLDKVQESI